MVWTASARYNLISYSSLLYISQQSTPKWHDRSLLTTQISELEKKLQDAETAARTAQQNLNTAQVGVVPSKLLGLHFGSKKAGNISRIYREIQSFFEPLVRNVTCH